jgi:hypothetical protein
MVTPLLTETEMRFTTHWTRCLFSDALLPQGEGGQARDDDHRRPGARTRDAGHPRHGGDPLDCAGHAATARGEDGRSHSPWAQGALLLAFYVALYLAVAGAIEALHLLAPNLADAQTRVAALCGMPGTTSN